MCVCVREVQRTLGLSRQVPPIYAYRLALLVDKQIEERVNRATIRDRCKRLRVPTIYRQFIFVSRV